jgi:GT2 family glycosyltransferase
MPDGLTTGVTIATHNRCGELHRTLSALATLDPQPDEVLVCADGCTDGTAEMVRREFPHVRLFENPTARGSIATRDFLIRQATADVLLGLDDDSHPVEADFVTRLRAAFAHRPRAAVITFPQLSDEYPESLTRTDWGLPLMVHSYPNSGAALRRTVYLSLAGYPGFFFHAYEETDYALQCYAAGHEVWYEPDMTVRHYYTSTGRSEQRTHRRHARNEQWSVWMRCPWPYLPLVAGWRALSQFRYACKRGFGWVVREPVWWWQAVRGLPKCVRNRRPVSWSSFLGWMRLARQPKAELPGASNPAVPTCP